MAMGVVSASREEDLLVVEVCPRFRQGCGCEAPGRHPIFRFLALPPDDRAEAEWAAACAREALRLAAAAEKVPRQARVSSVEGMTL
ncbi:MAG: hypothetical protein QHJ73_11585 [Armatimonadota bacterium]|nr:hypothetical protein [Armatimonadota bacterium]